MKKRAALLLLAVAILLALVGCHAPAVPTESQPPATPEPAATEETPAPEPEPQPEPKEVPPPQPDTMPGNKAHARVTVMAHPLTYSSVTVDGEPYFALQDLAEVLEGAVALDDATVTLTWAEGSVEIRAKSGIWFSETASGILPGAVYRSGELLFAPLALLEDVLGLTCTASEDGKTLYYDEAASWDIPAGYSVPVLMYHAVSDETWGVTELFVRPSEMEAQLQYLQENGFTPIFFSDLSHVEDFEKPVLLTFDDGYKNNYEELFPLLQKYNMKATIFVVTGNLDKNPNFMTWDQAREMVQSGLVAIESHTVTHPDLDVQPRERQLKELEESQAKILEEIGIPSQVLCFPTGKYNQTTLELMEGRYEIGLLMNGGGYITGSDPFRIPRWYVSRYTTLGSFAYLVK